MNCQPNFYFPGENVVESARGSSLNTKTKTQTKSINLARAPCRNVYLTAQVKFLSSFIFKYEHTTKDYQAQESLWHVRENQIKQISEEIMHEAEENFKNKQTL